MAVETTPMRRLSPYPSRQYFEFYRFDADTARWLLTFNTGNRGPKDKRIEGWARDMAAGRWNEETAEAVKVRGPHLDDPQRLQDGQNRLTALTIAGRSRSDIRVGLWVAFNVPDDAQLVMDSGAPRNMSDYLAVRGESDTRVVAAALRFLWRYERDELAVNAATPTKPELAAILDECPEVAECVSLGRAFATATGFGSPGVGTALAFLFTHADPDGAAAFFTQAITGADLHAGDAILILRNQLMRRRSGPSTSIEHRAAWAVKAFNAARTGRGVEVFGWRRTGIAREPFPRPLAVDEI